MSKKETRKQVSQHESHLPPTLIPCATNSDTLCSVPLLYVVEEETCSQKLSRPTESQPASPNMAPASPYKTEWHANLGILSLLCTGSAQTHYLNGPLQGSTS